MPIDLAAVRKKLEQLNSQYPGSKEREWFDLDMGDNWLRICPSIDGGMPFREIGYHFKNIGNNKWRAFQCPRITYNKPCPVCEALDALRNKGEKWTDQEKKLAKSLTPEIKALWAVVSRNPKYESTKVHWFISQNTIYKKFLSYFADPAYGDISDPNNGRDMCVVKAPKPNTTFHTYDARPAANPSPICKSQEEYATIMGQLKKFDELLDEIEYDELSERFFGSTDDDQAGTRAAYHPPQTAPLQQPAAPQYAAPAPQIVPPLTAPQQSPQLLQSVASPQAQPTPTPDQAAPQLFQPSAAQPQAVEGSGGQAVGVAPGAVLTDNPANDVKNILDSLRRKKGAGK